ncbi:MAG: hypothetical protein M3Z24_00250 [Chloroflexota bacterium]|nr:hypothetical protein [Chloroflexota bacterium]
MQAVSYRKKQAPVENLVQDDTLISPILHFTLQGTLPAQYRLALNVQLGTLSCFAVSNKHPVLAVEAQFTNSELSLLLPLLKSFPHYCPYEVLFAHFYNSNVTEPIIARSRQHLHQVLERGTWEQELKPVRNVLSRTRLKLRSFGINILSILETGCILTVVGESRRSLKIA